MNSKNVSLLKSLHKKLETELSAIREGILHAPIKGGVVEEAWREYLRKILPQRYGVGSGFVVDSNGGISDAVDVIIFDRQYSSMIFNADGHYHFPIESVFAVFEVKQDVSAEHIEYAAEKAQSVRVLKATSAKVRQIDGKLKAKKILSPIGGLLTLGTSSGRGITAAQKKKAKSYRGKKALELVFAISGGAIVDGQLQAGYGLVEVSFWLLSALQRLGNAPALDYGVYLERFKRLK